MAAFNPTARAGESISEGLVVTQVSNLHEILAVRAEVEPGSAQVVLGGIGSGKTTQLLLAQQHLAAEGPHSFFAEVSRFTDLNKAGPGTLAAIVSDQLIETSARLLPNNTLSQLREFAHGQWIEPEPPDIGTDDFVFIPGRLKPPLPPMAREVAAFLPHLESAFKTLELEDSVFLFDGLDRIAEPDAFWRLVESDLRLFKQLKISVVIVAPWSLAFRSDEKLSETFDRVHEIRMYASSQRDEILKGILSTRDSARLINEESIDSLTSYSGGIIRDLITLARDAGEAAYRDGVASIELHHVKSAATNLGRSYAMGLDPSQIRRLRQIGQSTSDFSPSEPQDLFLLLTRRVLHKSPGVFQVHPTLYPLPR